MQAEILFDQVSETCHPPEGFAVEEIMSWLKGVAAEEGKSIDHILYVFCDDSFLLDLNQQYLNHDTLTDIITFPYSDNPISAEIYISLERVQENAAAYNNGNYYLELCRVIVHGLLHMCGYNDHNPLEKETMRNKESHYLQAL
ncbi:MAG: rRNA maturation RNase YbeY [Saprospiraceae bacterium]|nr:rRNA maturation RNase YbeY [Saprospiraceae bacterium]